MRQFAPLALAVLLAGCMSTGPGDPRVINVEASAAPAGTTLTQSMNALVDRTGPAYVTVIVHEAQQRNATANSMLPNALTSGSGFFRIVVDNNRMNLLFPRGISLEECNDCQAVGNDVQSNGEGQFPTRILTTGSTGTFCGNVAPAMSPTDPVVLPCP